MNIPFPKLFTIEVTLGCPLRCPFCGINALNLKRNEYHLMSTWTLARVCSSIRMMHYGRNCDPRIFFAGNGEPTSNPDIIPIVNMARAQLPDAHIMLASNGVPWLKTPEKYITLLQRGLDHVIVDAYSENVADAVQELRFKVPVYDYYDQLLPAKINPFGRCPEVKGSVVIMRDLAKHDGKTVVRKVHNYGGNGEPKLSRPLRKVCWNTFREMFISWDGIVPICCVDARRRCVFGNALKERMDIIWDRMESARRFLRWGMRIFAPCNESNTCLSSTYAAVRYSKYLVPTCEDCERMNKFSATNLEVIKEAFFATIA